MEIIQELKNAFNGQIDGRIEDVRFVHNGSVYLEIYRTDTKDRGRRIETIIRNDLSIIVEDPENDNSPMFSVDEDIEKNIDLFLSLDKYTLVNTTDIFDDVASDKISKKYNIFKEV